MPPRLRHLSHYVYTTVYCICSSTLISDGTLEIHLFSHSISCDFQREKDFQCGRLPFRYREREKKSESKPAVHGECVCVLSFPVRPCIFPCLSFATQTNFRSSSMKIIKFNASPMHAYAAYLRNAVNFVLCESIKEQNATFPLISLFS